MSLPLPSTDKRFFKFSGVRSKILGVLQSLTFPLDGSLIGVFLSLWPMENA